MRIDGQAYMSLYEVMAIIQKKYPYADADYRSIESLARECMKNESDLCFTKKFRARTHRGVTLYTAQTMVAIEVGQAMVACYELE